jgi:hypothetical protein
LSFVVKEGANIVAIRSIIGNVRHGNRTRAMFTFHVIQI